jgi:hypothetical protein
MRMLDAIVICIVDAYYDGWFQCDLRYMTLFANAKHIASSSSTHLGLTMARIAQLGIALGALGAMLTFMGLFPGVTGLQPARGIGIVQIVTILMGFALLIIGALVYVKFTFYPQKPSNLTQQIGTRLALTGLLFAAMSGMADVLGFGSHLRSNNAEPLFGSLQALGIIGSFVVAAIGVLIYSVSGSLDSEK